ncbi:hypothetical protein P6144_04450 [Sphingomonas sp. HITSZ_GF]|uniref:hypothetical protein n=1 Tax=Sphingomonas sp. HITSZ_GF TaxID=3037247 RepID=UPI00240D573E|nr:hypothetical protein [Sphingomonas sp. HITSZ_GF]MDG2532885.1 hypothetical protein [Sphingomonas sp. HITSZ_GF]
MDDSSLPDPPEAEAPGALDFIPVPFERVRPDGWTAPRQRDFIAALATLGSVLHAARAVGMTKRSAYQLRSRPGAESFCEAWDSALAIGYADAYERALERLTIGIVTPRYYKGKQVGTRHRFDWRLAMAALNGTPPAPPQLRKNITR